MFWCWLGFHKLTNWGPNVAPKEYYDEITQTRSCVRCGAIQLRRR